MKAFNLTIHAVNRLQICSILAAVDTMEFAAVREFLNVSESVLSKHVKVLEDAGYVSLGKTAVQSRVRTWLALTESGRVAFAAHAAALKELAATADSSLQSDVPVHRSPPR